MNNDIGVWPAAPARRKNWYGAVLMAAAISMAAVGISWNRTRAATVTIDDAARMLATATTAQEREQALGAMAKHTRDMLRVMIALASGNDEATAALARAYLVGFAQLLPSPPPQPPPADTGFAKDQKK